MSLTGTAVQRIASVVDRVGVGEPAPYSRAGFDRVFTDPIWCFVAHR